MDDAVCLVIFPEKGAALLFFIQKFFDPEAMHLGHQKIKIPHSFRPLFLGKIDIGIDVSEDLQQCIMGCQIQAQALPHGQMFFTHVHFLKN